MCRSFVQVSSSVSFTSSVVASFRRMSSQDEQIQQRRANLNELAKLGIDVYPRRFERRHTIADLVSQYGERTRDELEAERIETTTSGRILAIRSFGKANFLV